MTESVYIKNARNMAIGTVSIMDNIIKTMEKDNYELCTDKDSTTKISINTIYGTTVSINMKLKDKS